MVKYDNQVLFEYACSPDTAASNVILDSNFCGTVSMPDTAASIYTIPEWLKDNARWWADGLISDEAYISGLQYLISQGIIKI